MSRSNPEAEQQLSLTKRPRRLRRNPSIRSLVSETQLTVDDLIYPMFVTEGENQRVEIVSMPDCYRYSLDLLLKEIAEIYSLGIKAVALFPVVAEAKKDDNGTEVICSRGKTICVAFNYGTKKPASIPDKEKEKMMSFEQLYI